MIEPRFLIITSACLSFTVKLTQNDYYHYAEKSSLQLTFFKMTYQFISAQYISQKSNVVIWLPLHLGEKFSQAQTGYTPIVLLKSTVGTLRDSLCLPTNKGW